MKVSFMGWVLQSTLNELHRNEIAPKIVLEMTLTKEQANYGRKVV